jgi:tetratricopeptide (TPR) repeat protein
VLGVVLFSWKKVSPVAINTILTGLLVITIGYSSYALIMIRSAANTPMDQNSPEDIFTLKTYLSREQYGETPLIYGKTYASPGISSGDDSKGVAVWTRMPKTDPSDKDGYFISMRKEVVDYPQSTKMFFPRMYDSTPGKEAAYKEWADVKGKPTRITELNRVVVVPTFAENLRYFFRYQVNYMYWRYFMWNFSGRQNDLQGQGEISRGNWITGIKFIDSALVGPQDDMPESIANNKGHNKYYMLPLLLGLLGILFQINNGKKGNQGFWIVFLLFFMTGLAIVLYLNQPPNQPRERDYAYAGSFYAFCIWIGLGSLGIIRLIRQYIKVPEMSAVVAGTILCLLVPIQMVSQTWDDHDRSDRYICRDFGRNYLTTCEPNSVIFTMGDNDTFPLWYAQEVDGYRTDVRVCNLSYLQTDWYIDQMKRQAYESEPLPISWTYSDYIQGKNESAIIYEQTKEPWEVSRALNRVKSDSKQTKIIRMANGQVAEGVENIPTKTLYIPVDSAAVIQSGLVKPDSGYMISKDLVFGFVNYRQEPTEEERQMRRKSYLTKPNMIIFDMINNNRDWKRPFYFAMTVGPDEYSLLSPYLRQDGIAFRVVPYPAVGDRAIDTDILYDNVMNKYRYGNLDKPGLYVDETSYGQASNFRSFFSLLARKLIEQGKTDSVETVLDYGLKMIPDYNVPFDGRVLEFADCYESIGKTDKAKAIYDRMLEKIGTNLNWYARLSEKDYSSVLPEINSDINVLYMISQFYRQIDPTKADQIAEDVNRHYKQLQLYLNRNRKAAGSNR